MIGKMSGYGKDYNKMSQTLRIIYLLNATQFHSPMLSLQGCVFPCGTHSMTFPSLGRNLFPSSHVFFFDYFLILPELICQ